MKSIFIFLLVFMTAPFIVFANGGDQRILGRDYLVNLSRSPFTPIAGTKTAMLVSFVDLKTGRLIKDDMLVSVRVTKGRGSRTFIYEQNNIPIKGGVLEWAYTFAESGIHELFFDFAFAAASNTRYEPPDFLIDVQEPTNEKTDKWTLVMTFIIGLLLGSIGCIFLRVRHMSKYVP